MIPKQQWWVLARSTELGSQVLLERTVAGLPMVAFRTTDGVARALDNRCAHRAFPLSRGCLVDDGLQCKYHGFTYSADGQCIRVPSQSQIPSRARVAAFPVLEQHPFVWVWTGDPEAASTAPLPDPNWLPDGWAAIEGTVRVVGSWRCMHENLLDSPTSPTSMAA